MANENMHWTDYIRYSREVAQERHETSIYADAKKQHEERVGKFADRIGGNFSGNFAAQTRDYQVRGAADESAQRMNHEVNSKLQSSWKKQDKFQGLSAEFDQALDAKLTDQDKLFDLYAKKQLAKSEAYQKTAPEQAQQPVARQEQPVQAPEKDPNVISNQQGRTVGLRTETGFRAIGKDRESISTMAEHVKETAIDTASDEQLVGLVRGYEKDIRQVAMRDLNPESFNDVQVVADRLGVKPTKALTNAIEAITSSRKELPRGLDMFYRGKAFDELLRRHTEGLLRLRKIDGDR